mgnify:CR=1 FL=1
MTKIKIENLYKVFGPKPEQIFSFLEQGMSKEDILQQTGHALGLIDISLSIDAGKIFVIMGLSGSGKSTLLRCVNRLIQPSFGKILIEGIDILAFNQAQIRQFRREKIGMVFQRFELYPHKTALQNITLAPMKVRKWSKKQAEKK